MFGTQLKTKCLQNENLRKYICDDKVSKLSKLRKYFKFNVKGYKANIWASGMLL